DPAATPSVDEVTIGFSRNTPPSAANDTYVMDQGTTLAVAAPGVLANDTDPDHDVLSAVLVSGPSHGTATLNADGSFSYTPQAGFNGSDSFTYSAGDGIAVSTPATVSITVRAVTPAANPDSYTVNQDVTLNVPAPGVLANDTDPQGRPLQAVLIQGPAHGTLTLQTSGSFTYTPAANYSGPDNFVYVAQAANNQSAPAVVSITVTPTFASSDWFMTAWSSGGSATSTNGNVMVDGVRVGTKAMYGPGRSLEFVATFSGDAWQHGGFGVDYNAGPWAIFSTFQGGGLYARTRDQNGQALDTLISGNWFGAPHRYRIDWNAANVVFSLDGTIVATHQAAITDSLRPLVSDFTPGGGSIVMTSIDMITPASQTSLSTSGLPADWFTTGWFEGGSATTSNGTLTIDGARAGSNVLYSPGQSLEFVAAFSGDAWQHIGFGLDYNTAPWIIFSTFQGGGLYARTRTQDGNAIDTLISGNWLGASHRYRIDWKPGSVVFSIDGTTVATTTVTIGNNLRALISDLNVGGGAIVVSSIKATQ
ncbi:MAG TPA: cadherin-like domain-containing protein, partial [Terriglobia bacterium]|nr:cadherin-like domain-containing protein [Terriglobia bacterium]